MNYLELENCELNNNIYILKGDSYLCNWAKNKIIGRMGIDLINLTEFNEENFDALDLVNACNQFSFFAEKRVVFISGLTKDLNADQKQKILAYSKSPNVDCVLIIKEPGNIFDFIKTAEIIECRPSENYVYSFIKSAFENKGKVIDAAAIKKLANFCLNNLNRIELEIKKICDYLGQENIVAAEIIDNLVFKDTELKVFDLTTHIGNKNANLAHELLYNMLKSGEPPIKILGLISAHFRRVFFAKINKDSNAELAKALGCKEYAIVKAKQEAAKFTAKQLKDIQTLILETDYNIKSGVMTQENALYYLLFKIVTM